MNILSKIKSKEKISGSGFVEVLLIDNEMFVIGVLVI